MREKGNHTNIQIVLYEKVIYSYILILGYFESRECSS